MMKDDLVDSEGSWKKAVLWFRLESNLQPFPVKTIYCLIVGLRTTSNE